MTKEKARICFLISDTNAGGSALSTRLLIKEIDRSKFVIIVVTCGPGVVAPPMGALADEYYNLNVGSFPEVRKLKDGRYREDFRAWFHLFIWLTRCIWKFTFWLRRHKVDLIHSSIVHFNLIGSIAGRLTGVPSVWHIRTPKWKKWRVGGPLLVEGYLAALLATRFIANSNYTANTFHHSWKRKTVVIWNGIDTKMVSEDQYLGKLRKLAGISEREKLVGISCMLSQRKGVDRFIEMASKLSKKHDDVRFVIIAGGHGNNYEAIKDELLGMVRELNLGEKVFFAENFENAPLYVGDMDVFFMASRPDTETFGLVVVEAMAAGVPVVAFANDAMPEIIDHEKTGILVPEGDIDAAAEQIGGILDTPAIGLRIAEAARVRVYKDFDVSVLISNVEKLCEEVTRGS